MSLDFRRGSTLLQRRDVDRDARGKWRNQERLKLFWGGAELDMTGIRLGRGESD